MNAFQIIVLPILGILFVERLAALRRARGGRGVVFFWAQVWLAAGVCVAAPGLTTRLAALLGIARGADFVFYCAGLVMFVGFFMIYARMRRLEANLTKLVRRLAMDSPMIPPVPPGSGPRAADAHRE